MYGIGEEDEPINGILVAYNVDETWRCGPKWWQWGLIRVDLLVYTMV